MFHSNNSSSQTSFTSTEVRALGWICFCVPQVRLFHMQLSQTSRLLFSSSFFSSLLLMHFITALFQNSGGLLESLPGAVFSLRPSLSAVLLTIAAGLSGHAIKGKLCVKRDLIHSEEGGTTVLYFGLKKNLSLGLFLFGISRGPSSFKCSCISCSFSLTVRVDPSCLC